MNNAFQAAMAAAGVPTSQGAPQSAASAFGMTQPQPAATSALDTIQTGTRQAGARIVIGGVEKAGKTTLACGAPRALLVPLEMGFGAMPVAKTKLIETYTELMSTIADIKARAITGSFPYRTVVFDTGTALEQRIHENVLASDKDWKPGNPKGLTMESALGGYGKAYNYANELFGKFLTACDELAFYGGINIVLTCHVFAAKVIDPQSGEYDTWDLLLHSPKNQKNYGKREMATQWADLVGFLHEPMFITKGDQLAQGVSMNQGRVLGVSRKPGYVAGNRYGVSGEVIIPTIPTNAPLEVKCAYSWNPLAEAVYVATGGQIDLYNRDVQ